MTTDNPFIVSADWLEENLNRPGLSIVDGSWYLPAHNRDPRGEYEAGHVPGAVFFDHDAIVDPDSPLPHAIPPAEAFARQVGAMGIAHTDTIVVYDGPGLFSAPRVWWLFRTMGAKDVRILDGGLDAWKREDRPLTREPSRFAPSAFIPEYNPSAVATLDDMRAVVGAGSMQIADARPAARFEGVEAEPRPGLRGGHMPGARNVTAASLGKEGRLLAPEELRRVLSDGGIDLRRPLVATCGSGVSAATIILALETLGHRDHKLYDGSWTEWGGLDDTPVETGKAR